MKNLAGFILIVATLGALGCHATFAPPARVAIGRMPEALGKGKVSIQAGAGAYGAEIRGAVGLSKGVELDVGATLGGWDKKEHLFALGSTGLRTELIHHKFFRLGANLGFGIGNGGPLEGKGDFLNRTALSVYGGLDLGFRLHKYFGIYLGNRYQLSWVHNIPITHWGYHVLGLQFDIGKHLFTTFEAGIAYFKNSADHLYHGLVLHGAIGYRF